MKIAKDNTANKLTQHSDRESFYVNEQLNKKSLYIKWVPTAQQLANVMTKALGPLTFERGSLPASKCWERRHTLWQVPGGLACACCKIHAPPAIVCLSQVQTSPVNKVMTHGFFSSCGQVPDQFMAVDFWCFICIYYLFCVFFLPFILFSLFIHYFVSFLLLHAQVFGFEYFGGGGCY